MIHIFKRIKSINAGPKVIHVITKKGYGYKFAEKEPVRFHGTQPFDVDTGKEYGKKKLSFSAVAGKTLCSLAEKDSRIVAVTAAMSAGTGLDEFSKKFPSKFFDVGIAEQHAVTFCAALAKNGYKPYFAVYSSFMQRAFDQLIHDVAVMNLPSVFLIDRAGIVGDDGETHHGMFDVSVFKTIPNFELLIPSDGEDLRDMIYYASKADHPVAIRYPRGYCGIESVDCTKPRKTDFSLPLKLSSSKDLIIIASADMKICAKEVSELLSNSKIKSGVVLIHSINALESAEFRTLIKNTDSFAVIESEYSRGGLSESILSILPKHKRSKMLASFGFPRKFIEHGPVDLLYDKYGLSSQKIASDIIEKLKKK
jgi:1-deoxy-D-xylulose-5-phosphate synthase